jgi:hypothetical protein
LTATAPVPDTALPARVLKPGGIACVATEYILEGADHREFFSPANLRRYVVDAAPLVMLDRLDDRPPPRSFFEDPIRFPDVAHPAWCWSTTGRTGLRSCSSSASPPGTTGRAS